MTSISLAQPSLQHRHPLTEELLWIDVHACACTAPNKKMWQICQTIVANLNHSLESKPGIVFDQPGMLIICKNCTLCQSIILEVLSQCIKLMQCWTEHALPSSLMASISALVQPQACPWLMIAATISRLNPKNEPPLMRSLSASASLNNCDKMAVWLGLSQCT